jgi:hypothetical protein
MTIPKSISISIDLNKIDQQYIVEGKNGARYLDLKLVNTPDNEYGNDYFVSQSLPKSVRDSVKESGGEYPKTPILGNAKAWQTMEGKANSSKQGASVEEPKVDQQNDLPF